MVIYTNFIAHIGRIAPLVDKCDASPDTDVARGTGWYTVSWLVVRLQTKQASRDVTEGRLSCVLRTAAQVERIGSSSIDRRKYAKARRRGVNREYSAPIASKAASVGALRGRKRARKDSNDNIQSVVRHNR